MDPALLAAIASAVTATAAAAGTDAWKALRALVDRASTDRRDRLELRAPFEAEVIEGEAVGAITAVLSDRAEADPAFAADVDAWLRSVLPTGDVHNVVRGSAQVSGPLLQGRDFSGTFNFGQAPQPPAGNDVNPT